MPSDSANGSTFKMGAVGDEVPLVSIDWSEDGQPIDITDLADTNMTYLSGIRDVELQVTLLGNDAELTVGRSDVVLITWNDGSTENLGAGNMVVTGRSVTGSVNSRIETTVTLKPTT